MRDRASQQAALAKLGQDALSGRDFDALLDEAVEVAVRELEADHVAVLERTRDGVGLLARAGAGLPDGVLGGVLPLDSGRLATDLGAASSLVADIGARFGVIGSLTSPNHGTPEMPLPSRAEFYSAGTASAGAASVGRPRMRPIQSTRARIAT